MLFSSVHWDHNISMCVSIALLRLWDVGGASRTWRPAAGGALHAGARICGWHITRCGVVLAEEELACGVCNGVSCGAGSLANCKKVMLGHQGQRCSDL